MISRALRRLEKELSQIKKDYQTLEVIVPDEEQMEWRVSFEGPEGSIYESERFT